MPDLRENFEAWTKTLPVEINLTRFEDAHYFYADTAERWEAYSAGYAEAVKDVAKLVESRWLDQASYRREILALIPGDAP